jgi:response regulator of citrate/malate metabolism
MAKIDRIINEIKDILRKETRGLTIQELSNLTKVSRITAAMALARLEGGSVIDVRIIGNCRLHYLKKNE